jgi:cytochrome oxidase Cu insertion factor (SCO1/SenC/PrrC family)
MKKMYWTMIILAISVGMLFYFDSSDASDHQQQTTAVQTNEKPSYSQGVKAKIGYQAPHFQLDGLDQKTYSLKSLQGKPVVINFWAT